MHLNPKILRDPQFNLSKKDQRHLMRHASNKWFKQPLNIIIYAIFTLGWMVALGFLPRWLQSQGLGSTAAAIIQWFIIYPLVFITLFYRFRFLRHIHQELRDLGHDICPNCGYTLINLPESKTKCPECGTIRTKPDQAPIVTSA